MSAGMRGRDAASAAPASTLTAANDHLGVNDVVAVRAAALLEQLLAMRVELGDSVLPRAERGVLTKRDLDYMRVQLDAAVASTRGIIATCGGAPVSIVRQRDFWRSEEVPATKA
jgi:hypothetical protein